VTKLTESQIIVLSGAAQREDGAATLPEAMKPDHVARGRGCNSLGLLTPISKLSAGAGFT
jgi:hypothetical protein